jgi:branched-chain amino acid transport system permease protein
LIELVISTIINALGLSALYILVALGFAFLFNILGVLNFAHGAIYMVGGYICYQLAVVYHINQWVALVLAVIAMGVLGLFLEKFAFRRFFGDMDRTIVLSIAIILVLETSVNVTVGTYTRTIPSFAPGHIGTGLVSISTERLVAFIIGASLLAIMLWFINKTKQGQQMQAISQSLVGAALQGINIHRISGLACFIACGLAAVSGSVMGSIFNLSPFMGGYVLVKAVEIVILGGIGSVGGVIFAGLIIGTLDTVLPLMVTGAVSQAIGFGVVVVLLIFRPRGFLGREQD